ncbi:ATP-grasp fold amidoligase family protein, partial [Campylobacter coli]
YNKIYESGFLDQKNDWTWFLGYNRNSGSKKISSKLWLERYKHIGHFAFVWQGVINFRFLKNIDLKFIDGIFHQDVHFGFLLFAQSSYIYLLSKKLLVYRIRNGATTVRNFKNNLKDEIPFYIQELLSYFEIKTAKEYYSIYSWIQIILNVMHSHNIKNNLHSDLYYLFIGNLSEQILKLKFSYKQDPMHLSGFINFIKTFVGLHRILQNNMQKNSVQLNQLQSKLSFQSQHGTAKQRIQNQLSYKLGQTMIINSKNIFGILFMPVYIISTLLSHKQEQKIYQEKIKKDPSLKLPSLESYPDYKEALKFKNHLSYKLGQALIKANKTWYKGGYVRFLFELRKIYKQKTMKNSLILYKNRDSNKKDTTRSIRGGGDRLALGLDEQYFIKRHESFFHYKPDFRNPKTFNEKIIHRILFDRRDIYTFLADKIKVRLYIQFILEYDISNGQIYKLLSKNIDELSEELKNTNKCSYLPEIYGIYKHTDEIDFDFLPNSFVIKTNHDWGGVVVVNNKAEFLADSSKKIESLTKLQKHLDRNYYDVSKEWHYKNITPRIFIEENLSQKNNDLKDYRFHVFNHKTQFIQVANSAHTCNNLYYPDWKIFPIMYLNKRDSKEIQKPYKLKKMLKLASLLSIDFDYIRVDMYLVDSKIYIGELTFTPNCGKAKIEPAEWDLKLGQMWRSDVFKL